VLISIHKLLCFASCYQTQFTPVVMYYYVPIKQKTHGTYYTMNVSQNLCLNGAELYADDRLVFVLNCYST